MKKAFTLIELMVSIGILCIIVSVVMMSGNNTTGDDKVNALLFPKEARAQAAQQSAEAQMEMAKQLAEQNRLLRLQIEQKKQ